MTLKMARRLSVNEDWQWRLINLDYSAACTPRTWSNQHTKFGFVKGEECILKTT